MLRCVKYYLEKMLFWKMQIENDTYLYKAYFVLEYDSKLYKILYFAFMKLNIIVNIFSVDLLTFKCNRKLACNLK